MEQPTPLTTGDGKKRNRAKIITCLVAEVMLWTLSIMYVVGTKEVGWACVGIYMALLGVPWLWVNWDLLDG